jgi:hypothetical protein
MGEAAHEIRRGGPRGFEFHHRLETYFDFSAVSGHLKASGIWKWEAVLFSHSFQTDISSFLGSTFPVPFSLLSTAETARIHGAES